MSPAPSIPKSKSPAIDDEVVSRFDVEVDVDVVVSAETVANLSFVIVLHFYNANQLSIS